ncbi:MAG: ABC transporter permease [Deltaproteobacteria bacterium]|nr:ABC transporter permease [Deltaproteobacteria bacterium]MDZ4347636.1 ABC transporter permease [Candidatus Binatia bacterium]
MSGQLFRLAWRNLWRNPRRTSIAMAAIGFGYVMLLFVACLMAGLRHQMIESGTGIVLSNIEVHAPAYYPNRSIHQTLGERKGTNVSALLAAITADRQVYAATPRVYGYGLVSAAHQSAGAEILGVDPKQEQKVTVLHTRIVKGSYLSEQIPKGIVMGDKLATTIGVEVGSEIVLLTQAADGSMGNDLYTIVGIFHTNLDDMDQGLVLMGLTSLQELLRLPPVRIHEVAIKLHDITEATTAARALQIQLNKTLPVRVRAWPELAPELADYVQFNRSVTFILFSIFFLLAIIGIVNTMLMAVIERTRELGMLMAVGMRPVQVVGLILAEAAGLAGASLVLGGAIGVPLLWYLQVHGLDLGSAIDEFSLAGVAVGRHWYGRQDFFAYSQAALGLAVTALASALYPALRAARFRPTEALRKV